VAKRGRLAPRNNYLLSLFRKGIVLATILCAIILAGVISALIPWKSDRKAWLSFGGSPWRIGEGKFRMVVKKEPYTTRDGIFHQLGPVVLYRFTAPARIENQPPLASTSQTLE
jgi:hypothetical protein